MTAYNESHVPSWRRAEFVVSAVDTWKHAEALRWEYGPDDHNAWVDGWGVFDCAGSESAQVQIQADNERGVFVDEAGRDDDSAAAGRVFCLAERCMTRDRFDPVPALELTALRAIVRLLHEAPDELESWITYWRENPGEAPDFDAPLAVIPPPVFED